MPADAVLNPVAAPASAVLRSGDSGAFDAAAFDPFAFAEDSQDVPPTAATLNDVPAPTPATLVAA